MPRNVRNFWTDLNVDGRESMVGTGPRSRDGGIYQDWYIRHDGMVVPCLTVRGNAQHDGTLRLTVLASPAAREAGVEVATTYTHGMPELVLRARR